MIVYVRTGLGQNEAYKADSTLPRKLRTILKLVDGTTTISTYEQSLQSFGDIRLIFSWLVEAGLIKAVPKGSQQAQVDTHLNTAEQQSAAERSNAGSKMPERSPSVVPVWSGQPASSDIPDEQTFQQASAQAFVMDEKKASALKAAVNDMERFVLEYLGEQSFSVLTEIEAITSIELLAVTFGGYEQLVSHLGPASDAHLKYIKQVISENT